MVTKKKVVATKKPASNSNRSTARNTTGDQIKSVSTFSPVAAQPIANVAPTNVGPATLAPNTQLDPTALSAGSQLDLTKDNEFRGNQQTLIGQLQDQANGVGPSVAGLQFKAAADQNIAQQKALAASQRGASGALAGRQAMINAAGINQNLAGQSSIQRLQEEQAAQQALGNVINQGRTADQNAASQNAGLTQSNNQFNAGQQNTGIIAQGGLTNSTNLANAAAANTLQGQQGAINANAALANAGAQNQSNNLTQQLTTQTGLANSGATNAAGIANAQIKGQENVAGTYVKGSLGAAGLQAGASKYATDANVFVNQLNDQLKGDQIGGGGVA